MPESTPDPPTTRSVPRRAFLAHRSRMPTLVVLAGALLPAIASGRPVPVSPGALQAGYVSEARCPTFSWAGAPGAIGYELAVYRLATAELETLVLRVSLPPEARSWTPSLERCLERGARYSWSVRARPRGGTELDWATPLTFEIEAARTGSARVDPTPDEHEPRSRDDALSSGTRERPYTGTASLKAEDQESRQRISRLDAQASEVVRTQSAATTPTLGNPSLRVSANVALGPATNLFKDGDPFLWDDASDNLGLGRLALGNIDGNASDNVAVGALALHNVTGDPPFEGEANTAVGHEALRDNTTGDRNTATGASALRNNTTGYFNTATGAYALFGNTTGRSNTASGSYALRGNTTGRWNTATGHGAMRANTTGDDGTALGYEALRGNTTGHDNTAVGSGALGVNTVGFSNTAVGSGALQSNIANEKNTAVGASALSSSTGWLNTAVGASAASATTTGVQNIAIGVASLPSNTTGSHNVGIGSYSLDSNLVGSSNIALGNYAGFYTTGSDNIVIASQGAAGESNVLRIGDGTGSEVRQLEAAFVHGIFGRSVAAASDTPVLVDGTGKLGTTTSSARFKRDIADIGGPTDSKLLALRPVSFRYRPETGRGTDALRFGLVAEEVAEVFPELVDYDEDGKPFSVKYHLLPALLLDLLQEQHAQLEAQGAELEAQRAEIRALRADLERSR